MKTLRLTINEPQGGYASYQIVNETGYVVFQSSAPAHLVQEIANRKTNELEREGRKS